MGSCFLHGNGGSKPFEVMRKTGTFTLSGGAATVSCGFKPDFVRCYCSDSEMSFYTEGKTSAVDGSSWESNYQEYLEMALAATSTGFKITNGVYVKIGTGAESTLDGYTFSYIAVKYTEDD